MTTNHVPKAFTVLVRNPPQGPPTHERLGSTAAGAVLAVLALTACGADDSSGTETASAAALAAPSGPPNGADFQEIRACLEAAGLETSDFPTGAPSGMPAGRPSGLPSGAPSDLPSDFPSGPPPGMPSGAPGGGGGGGGAMNLGAEAQAALVACGITMPSRPPAGAATPTPSATP